MSGNSSHEEKSFFERALEAIPQIIKDEKVVTDRELKVRLEGEAFPGTPGPFPWVVEQALKELVKRCPIKKRGYRGRKRTGQVQPPSIFYVLNDTPYSEVEEIIERKRLVTAQINQLITGDAIASAHAENIFLEAFLDLGFEWDEQRDVSKFRDKKVSHIEGKSRQTLSLL